MSEQIKLSSYEEKELIWNDISGLEAWRTYFFAGGGEYKIERPVLLNVRRSDRGDSHRIIDGFGVRHYISPTWVAFRFGGEWSLAAKVEVAAK